jgi:hypothetical protein
VIEYLLHVVEGAVNVGKVNAPSTIDLHFDEPRRQNCSLAVDLKVGIILLRRLRSAIR